MKFYNRDEEIIFLKNVRSQAFSSHSRLTVLTGRRRIGKTLLLREALSDQRFLYLFVAKSSEAILCQAFCREASQALGIFVPPINNFADFFRFLMEEGRRQAYTLIIDEFQELESVNPAIFSHIQNYWDQYRQQTRINFVVSGSAYSMMQHIFTDRKEPLFGRADRTIHLQPFSTSTLKEILRNNAPNYQNDDLLALYTFTGGVPKYIEMMMDNGAFTVSEMIANICQPNSPFIDEGRSMLIQEFGKKYNTYFSILQGIANGYNTQSKLEGLMPNVSIGGYLKKLEDTYNLVEKRRPMLAKPGSQTVRYAIKDPFLNFWFRYIDGNQSLVELGNYSALNNIILNDYPTFSGKTLERYFIQQMTESMKYSSIGSWWESKGDQNEIDIVALGLKKGEALVAEVKRQRKNFKPDLLNEKINVLRNKVLPHYKIESVCFTLNDM